MVRPRLAIAELTLSAAIFVVPGVVIGAIGIATATRDELLGGALLLALVLAVGVLFVRRDFRNVTRRARPEERADELARPVYLTLVYIATLVVLLGFAVLVDIALPTVGAILFGVGMWQVALAARLRRWEQRTGRTLLLRPKFRMPGGWTAAENFSFR